MNDLFVKNTAFINRESHFVLITKTLVSYDFAVTRRRDREISTAASCSRDLGLESCYGYRKP
jgi:hypothetical protein